MKSLFRTIIFLTMGLLLTACGQSVTATPSPTITITATFTPIPSQTTTATIEATPRPTYVPPTLIPTIDPKLVPELLKNALSIQPLEGINGHNIQKITGWDYGFRQEPCYGYQWLDSSHLLLYPRTGEGRMPHLDGSIRGDLSSEHVVINLTNGNLWLRPPYSVSTYEWNCESIYWSQELGIIINQENIGNSYASHEGVSTYTFDGKQVARYWGKILGVSPSGEKILVDDDTIIDLRENKTTDLAWYINYDLEISSRLYWSSDETRVYRCCFYYADLKTGKSYNLEWGDLRGFDGKPISFSLKSPHIGGQWVRNDTYFFPMWDYMSYAGDPAMIFSPAEKKFYFIELPSPSTINPETQTYKISPDGMQVWITGYGYDGMYHSFLIDLTTFATVSYDLPVSEFEWSPDSQFALLETYSDYDANGISHTYLLSVSNKKVEPIDWDFYNTLWHPTDHILTDLMEEGQVLAIFDAKDMSVNGWKLPAAFGGLIWSPDGSHIALVAKDGSFWQVDYPKLDNLEQITPPLPNVSQVNWSPDGTSIAFISGMDIYVVETTNK